MKKSVILFLTERPYCVDPLLKKFAPSNIGYVETVRSKAEVFDVSLFAESTSLQEYFSSNAHDRAKNTHIANLLLPIFEKEPCLWTAVTAMKPKESTDSFRDWFMQWRTCAPADCMEGISEIARVFGFSI